MEKEKIELLEKYIHDLERQVEIRDDLIKLYKLKDELKLPQIPMYLPIQIPTLHFHNGHPCYNNPCIWC